MNEPDLVPKSVPKTDEEFIEQFKENPKFMEALRQSLDSPMFWRRLRDDFHSGNNNE